MSTQMATFSPDSYTYNPAEYVDAGATLLPLPGVYRMRVTSLGRRKDRETGAEILKDGVWPTLVLNRVEIVEPIDETGTFALFEELYTKPYLRKGQGRELPAAKHMDLLRAIDQHAQVGDFLEGVQEVERLLSSGQTFVAQLGYRAQDTEWAKAEIARSGGKDAMTKEAYNAVWTAAKLSTKDFKNPSGGYRTQTVGRSGAVLEAKLTLTKFIPSDTQVDLGPYLR
jgi:hypothetical protein